MSQFHEKVPEGRFRLIPSQDQPGTFLLAVSDGKEVTVVTVTPIQLEMAAAWARSHKE